MSEFWIDPESPHHKKTLDLPKHFILYCASDWKSALASKTHQDMGLKNVCHIEGGFNN